MTKTHLVPLKLVTVSIDSVNAAQLAQWWADVLGRSVQAFPEAGFWNIAAETAGEPHIGFCQVEDPTPGKNRLHIDFFTPDRTAAVAGLVEAGAKVVYEGDFQGLTWTTLADPDGNVFDVTDSV